MGQEFRTTDFLRFEVEAEPTGLVNLVQNPNGELGGWGWITSLTASAMVGAAGPRLRYERSVAGASFFTTEAMPVEAGYFVAARLSALSGTGVTHFRLRFEWLETDLSVLSSSSQSGYFTVTVPDAQTNAAQAPPSSAYVRLRVDLYASNTGTAPAVGHSFELTGVTVAAAETAADLGLQRRNLVPNPSFETNTTGWATVVNGAIARSSAQAAVGVWSLELTTATSPGKRSIVATPAGTGGIPVSGGTSHAFQVRARAAGAGRNVAISLQWYDAAGAPVGFANGPLTMTSSTDWLTLSLVATAPAAAAFVSVRFQLDFAAAGELHYFDAVLLEQADAVGSYFDGSTVAAGGWDYSWTGTAHASTSEATKDASLAYIPPVQYFDVLHESHQVRVNRTELNAGRLGGTILSRTLDPSQSDLIRPGRRARLTVLIDGVWETLIAGTMLEADVTYELKDPKVPDERRARIEVLIVDPGQALANTTRAEGVATIDELPFVLEGAGVPWSVNGSGNQVPTADVTTYNDAASALNQVALTRDTALGFAWVSRVGVLNVWDRDQIPSGSPVLLDESAYSDIDLSFSTKDCVNEVTVVVQAAGVDGSTEETTYGPFRDAASIKEWGRYAKTFTVTGLDSAQVETYAAAVLAAASTPRIRVNSVTIPLTNVARLEAHALRDLYDEVNVVLTELGVDDTLRVTGIEHVIELSRWMLVMTFADEGGVAQPTIQPPVQSGARPDVGVLELFAGPTSAIPPTKLRCDGASYPVASYPHLFAVIGYTFGGAGAFFNVPNLVDRFPIGAGTKALGSTGGAASRALTTANLPSIPVKYVETEALAAGSTRRVNDVGNVTGGTGTSVPLGSGTAVDILNPWLSIHYVIRAA